MKARLPQGYGGGGAGNMQSMLKQAQKMQEDMARLQADLVAAAVNEAIRQAVETSETEMAKITGGAGLPGMF